MNSNGDSSPHSNGDSSPQSNGDSSPHVYFCKGTVTKEVLNHERFTNSVKLDKTRNR